MRLANIVGVSLASANLAQPDVQFRQRVTMGNVLAAIDADDGFVERDLKEGGQLCLANDSRFQESQLQSGPDQLRGGLERPERHRNDEGIHRPERFGALAPVRLQIGRQRRRVFV
jgi:hypothetical protein